METSTLAESLAQEFLSPAVHKGWFSGEYVRLGEFMHRAQHLFETGCVLGFSYRDRLGALAELLSEAGLDRERLAALNELAAAQQAIKGEEPQSLLDVFFKPEAERLMKLLRDAGATRRSSWNEFPKVAKKRMPLAGMLLSMQIALRKGVAFGSHYPEITENLFLQTPDEASWKSFRARNHEVPSLPPEPVPVTQRRPVANSMIVGFVELHRPDLLARLGLWPEDSSDVRLRLRALRARRAVSD